MARRYRCRKGNVYVLKLVFSRTPANASVLLWQQKRAMTIRLRDALAEILEGWPADVDPAWRPLAEGVALGFDAVAPDLMIEPWEPVFPSRRGRRFPGAPEGAHMLRAFDGPPPERVRCVILGQDPYPCPAFATGRAFESGNVARWRELEKMFSCSIRTLLQLIASVHTGDARYAAGTGAWARVIADIEDGTLVVASPAALVERWVAQGVLALNASLTLSRFAVEIGPHQRRGHLPLWRPLMLAVLRALASRGGGPVVFLGFGDVAAALLAEAGLIANASPDLHCILRDHPAVGDAILALPNPLQLANDWLASRGAAPLDWGAPD
jgi:uracil-DNA glycosylase